MIISSPRSFRTLFAVVLLSLASPASAIDYGTPVPDGDYPTVGLVAVSLGENQSALGTGTMIARNVVLTAAHVIQDAPTPASISFRAILGNNRFFTSRVILYRTHPGYLSLRSDSLVSDAERTFMDTDMLSSSASDIALLLLEKPFPDSFPLYPLASKTPSPDSEAIAVGFGHDEVKKSGNPRKRQGTLQYLKEHDRALLFRTPKGSSQRTDHGDSGGPLLIREDGKEKIAAITHGFFTAIKIDDLSPDEYGIYVSMSDNADWIETNLEQLSRYKLPALPAFYLARNNKRTPFLAVTARQIYSHLNADTPLDRLIGRAFSRGINEPIPADVAAGWQKRFSLPPGMLVPLKLEE